MDDSRFDALTRSLSTPGSRRRALGGLLAGALGMALDETTGLAKKKKKGKKKGKKKDEKKPNCFDLIRCGDECCARSESCCGNHCCLPFQTCCGNACCNGEETCRNGTTCVNHCNDGVQNFRETDTDCGGSCRNVRKCDVTQGCAEDADCESGVCVDRPGLGFICVPCRTDLDCERQNPETRGCFDNVCFECASNTDCSEGEVCNATTHSCAECVSDTQCGNAERPFCVAPLDGECPSDQPCVCRRCRTSDDCPDEEICDETGNCIECLSDTDCAAGKVCVQNTCRAPATCPAGADLCTQGFGSTTACGSGCRCHTTTDDETRCVGGSLESRCDAQPACTSRAECEARHGPGAVCVQDTGSFCGCAHCARQCTV